MSRTFFFHVLCHRHGGCCDEWTFSGRPEKINGHFEGTLKMFIQISQLYICRHNSIFCAQFTFLIEDVMFFMDFWGGGAKVPFLFEISCI